MGENNLAKEIVDACYKVHTTLGPGLLESVCETVLFYELQQRKLHTARQQNLPIRYEELILEEGYRADFIVENKVIVELKSVEIILPVH